jgi:hypothetical protein
MTSVRIPVEPDPWIFERLMNLSLTVALKTFSLIMEGIYLYVYLAMSTSRSHIDTPPLLVGSSSQTSITSTASSEGVALIGGRYGSVSAGLFALIPPILQPWADSNLSRFTPSRASPPLCRLA